MRYAKVNRCPAGGHVQVDYERSGWRWRVHRCNSCDVIVLPHDIRYLDPGYLRYIPADVRRWLQDLWWRYCARTHFWEKDVAYTPSEDLMISLRNYLAETPGCDSSCGSCAVCIGESLVTALIAPGRATDLEEFIIEPTPDDLWPKEGGNG